MANGWARACAAVVCVTVAAPALAASADWAEDLTFQIKDEVGCEVTMISQVVDRMVDGKRVVMAKVHCEDKRTFDAFRGEEFADFKFNECEPPEQKAC